MTDVKIRRSTSDDKDDVIRINNKVYTGSDFLPEYYDEFMACSNTTSYVAVMNDKIVGFTSMFLVDDGKTVISRASRVSPSVEGKGVYKILHNYTLKETSAERVAFTVNNLNEAVKKPSFQQEHTLLGSKLLFMYRVNKVIPCEAFEPGELHSPRDEEWLTYFDSVAAKSYLFPMDRILVDWVPFRLLKCNISLLKKKHRTRIYSDVTEDKDGEVHGLLTVSTTKRVQYPPYYCDLNIYGTDTKTLFQHISMHLRGMIELSEQCKNITVIVVIEQEFDIDALDKVFNDIGLPKSVATDSNGLVYSYIQAFEKKLKQ